MLDFPSEDNAEEREREIVDELAEHEHFEHHRGDDRLEQIPDWFFTASLTASGRTASLSPNRGQGTPSAARTRPTAWHLLSQSPASGDSAPGGAGELNEERYA